MKIATWNVNSVRLRVEQMIDIVAKLQPDVLCLQETKVPCDKFPAAEMAALGFAYRATSGMKSYNGVAILSKRPLEAIQTPVWCGREDCRHLVATVDGVEIHNLYIPAGGDEPDPEVNPKFAHKLQFLQEITDWYGAQDAGQRKVLLGDLNIAPLETDVWSHKQLLKVVSHTPVEVAALGKLQASLSWVDAVRAVIPPEEKLFTWWSYRAKDWALANRGRRLDHIWVTPPLQDAVRGATVLKETRDYTPPSDHVPVMVELAL